MKRLSIYLAILFGLLGVIPSSQAVTELERDALMALYNGTNGTNWSRQNGWGIDSNPCNWAGVTCNVQQEITDLYFGNNNMVGSIPSAFSSAITSGGFQQLEGLSFNGNAITGNIPSEFGSLSALRILHMGDNQLSGGLPVTLGNLTNLQELILFGNQLGTNVGNPLEAYIPLSFGNLSALRVLRLAGNSLQGPIPASLGNLSNMVYLSLSTNMLTGPIPAELGNLSRLERLNLSRNQLTGTLPSSLGSLGELTNLDLHSNALTGRIPDSFANLTRLTVLNLNYNGLYRENDSLLADLNALYGGDILLSQTLDAEGMVVQGVGELYVALAWSTVAYTQAGGYHYYLADNPEMNSPRIGNVPDKNTVNVSPGGLYACTVYYAQMRSYTEPHPFNVNQVESDGHWGNTVRFMTRGSSGCAPVIVDGLGTFHISESAPAGSFVTTLESLDSDDDELTYSITAGDDAGMFSIGSQTGALTVAGSLDYETTSTYSLTISVDDGTGNVTTGAVTINITDVAETPAGNDPNDSPAAGGGGGCTLKAGSGFDPIFPILILAGSLLLFRQKQAV